MKNYKAVVNVKEYNDIIFRAGDINEGDWDGETLTLWAEQSSSFFI